MGFPRFPEGLSSTSRASILTHLPPSGFSRILYLVAPMSNTQNQAVEDQPPIELVSPGQDGSPYISTLLNRFIDEKHVLPSSSSSSTGQSSASNIGWSAQSNHSSSLFPGAPRIQTKNDIPGSPGTEDSSRSRGVLSFMSAARQMAKVQPWAGSDDSDISHSAYDKHERGPGKRAGSAKSDRHELRRPSERSNYGRTSLSVHTASTGNSPTALIGRGRIGSIMKMKGTTDGLGRDGETTFVTGVSQPHLRKRERILVRTGNRYLTGYVRMLLAEHQNPDTLASGTALNSSSSRFPSKVKCKIRGAGIMVLDRSSFLVIPSQYESPQDCLSMGESVIARLTNDDYAPATVLGEYKQKVLIQYSNGVCNLLSPFDVIRHSVSDAQKLPSVKISLFATKGLAVMTALSNAAEIALSVILLFMSATTDYSMKDDIWLNQVQAVASALTALISLRCLYLSYSLNIDLNNTAQWLVTYKTITITFLDIISISNASLARGLLTLAGCSLRVGALFLFYTHVKLRAHWQRMRAEIAQSFREAKQRLGSTTPSSQDRSDMLYKKNLVSWKFFGTFSLSFLLFFFGITCLELWRFITNQNPMLNLTEMNQLRDSVSYEQRGQGVRPFGDPTGLKVFLVILDGMRGDRLHVNDGFRELLSDPGIKTDTLVAPMTVQLPSMSVPNWLTFLTGSPPWMTGVIGNAAVQLSSFESLFSVAFTSNRTTGLTGSSWLGDLVENYLDLTATGVNDASFAYQQGIANSEFADSKRASAINQVIKRRMEHDFYLAHFSDIDERGHHSGVTLQYNKQDSYNRAVSEKSKIVKNLFDSVDNKTVVMIVADHGHVDSGGHGGVNPLLTETFMITYMKGSGLGSVQVPNGINSVDVAPTVSAILGLPIPANSIGKIVGDVTTTLLSPLQAHEATGQWESQQRGLRRTFDQKLGTSFYDKGGSVDTTQDFSLAVSRAYYRNVVTNNLLMGFYALLAFTAFCSLVGRVTGLDTPFRLVQLRLTRTRTTRKGNGSGLSQDEIAFLFGVLMVLSYHAVTLAIYLLAWRIKGKTDWDSTVIHHPSGKNDNHGIDCVCPRVFVPVHGSQSHCLQVPEI
ncbi:hypothetical protein DFS34DRAFT_320314 [Phlyctochytrium arcticum]|nr:hypothetical protein DFS34DRAFT_320314 [Phlyctochytrium arcticum]